MAHKTVFLDEYSLGGHDLTPIRKLVDYKGFDRTSPDEVLRNCADAEIVISNKVVLSAETMRQLPKLRFIAIAATGMNNVDLEAARELGIEVRNAAGYSTYAVAEATLSAAYRWFAKRYTTTAISKAANTLHRARYSDTTDRYVSCAAKTGAS